MSVSIEDSPRDRPQDRVLAAKIGRILSEVYEGWSWRVDIPPEQDAVIIRNLTCDPYGKMGFFNRKSEIDGPDLEIQVIRAGGDFLERYEHLKLHSGKFRPDDLENRQMIFEKPEE